MTYINLEDVQKILESNIGCDDGIHDTIGISVIEKINYLPSIDFEEMIKEIIKDYAKLEGIYHDEFDRGATYALEKLLNKLPK